LEFSRPEDRRFWPSPRAFAALFVAFTIATIPVSAQPSRFADPPVSIEIVAKPITAFDHRDVTRRQFGLLEFRGGLVLTSPFREFGGISSIRVQPDGEQFIAASDKGWWLRGRITYSGRVRPASSTPRWRQSSDRMAGRLPPVAGTIPSQLLRMAPRFMWASSASTGSSASTTARTGSPRADNRSMCRRACARLPNNKGLEALAFVPRGLPLAGTLIAISERGLDKEGNILAFLIGGPRPGSFSVRRIAEFDVSDAALLPAGDLLLLERKFSWTSGLFIRIRRIAQAEIKAGAVVDGPILFEADLGYEIDNMEGLSVHRSASGETVLTLISDDNFSPLQRTMLLQFTLALP
jgi:hypothetical protein